LYKVVRLQSPKDHNNNNDQDGAKDTDATVTEAITVPAEAATEATKQENSEDDDEESSKRHILSPVRAPTAHRPSSRSGCEAFDGTFPKPRRRTRLLGLHNS
jgi:hypothetical protein